MHTLDGLTFVNRDKELSHLLSWLEEASQQPALIVIRAARGIGKSSLTDRLLEEAPVSGRLACTVDPNIRGRVGAVSLHNGFFLQRIAESLNAAATVAHTTWPSLTDFMKARRGQMVLTTDPGEVASELPSVGHAYKLVYDALARAFSFGRFTPEKLLASDQNDAVAICTAYVTQVLTDHAVILVVRETQHMDLESMNTLLEMAEHHPGPDLILEYTALDSCFEPEHQKLLHRSAGRRGGIRILDLMRLEGDHLELLIQANIRHDFELCTEFYLSWDGDLRTVMETRYQVQVGSMLTSDHDIGRTIANLSETLEAHIAQLTALERAVLAIIAAHVEAIDFATLSAVCSAMDPNVLHSEFAQALERLENEHAFSLKNGNMISLRNDTIASVVRDGGFLKGMEAIAEKALREHYRELIKRDDQTYDPSIALRQFFRLCARTKDAQSLTQAVFDLSAEIGSARDQSVYIDAVAAAVEMDPDLFQGEYDALILWAAELAYAASDWKRAVGLLGSLRASTPYSEVMRACALQECGEHDRALEIAATLKVASPSTDHTLACDLVKALVVGCRGQREEACKILTNVTKEPAYRESPLLGYAHRFFEIVTDSADRLPHLKRSVAHFKRHGLNVSEAYSDLAAAIVMARSGRSEDAHRSLAEATEVLADQIHDQHMILNNVSAVNLLSDQPDATACIENLTRALRLARDDFSELTILNNLCLALLAKSDFPEALRVADKCGLLLNAHDFADTDIYWAASFNRSLAYAAAGHDAMRRVALDFPTNQGAPLPQDHAYWQFRYGQEATRPIGCEFLLSRQGHPLYLSHWLIDLEGLSLLKQELHQ